MGKCFSRGDRTSVQQSHDESRDVTMMAPTTSREYDHGRDVTPTTSRDYDHGGDVTPTTSRDFDHGRDVPLPSTSQPQSHNEIRSAFNKHMVLSEKFLKNLASEIGAEWQLLFVELGLVNAELEQIDFDRGFNQVTKNWKAFVLWRQKNKERQASEQLRILLEGFQEIHRRDLVDKYTEYLDERKLKDISGYESCDVEPGLNILKQKLIDMNDEQTREIPLSPVTTDGDNLPIEHLFSSVVIREDVKENRKGEKSAQREEQQEGKTVKSPEDMLTKNGKPVPRVFMLGKAAHGKTTYCKWFLKTWCNTQQPNGSGKKTK